MKGEDTGRTLILAIGCIVGTGIVALLIGWVAFQAGLSQPVTVGATFIGMIVAVLAFLGFGLQTETTPVEPIVNIDEDDFPVQLPGDSREKETDPQRADFPKRWARFLRARGWEYASMQQVLNIVAATGLLIAVVGSMPFVVPAFGQLGLNIPPGLIALSERPLSMIGVLPMLWITLGGMAVLVLSMLGTEELSRVFEKTTCGDCDKDFCLEFEYALYNPNARETHEKEVYDDERNLKGVRTTGYTYPGTLYATCTTRDKKVENDDWSWYISK